jgi:hypothetical protein
MCQSVNTFKIKYSVQNSRIGAGPLGGWVCRYDTMSVMTRMGAFGLLLGVFSGAILQAQGPPLPSPSEDPVAVSADHPRLFLRPARLRLLRRERERSSVRWQQFDGFLSADAPMPEPAFAQALYYQVSGNREAGRKAVAWALGPGTDLRQLALVFDWCQDLLSDAERRALVTRIQQRMAQTEGDESVSSVRSLALAAITLFDHVPQTPNRELNRIVRIWWEQKMAAALNAGKPAVPREEAYALWELLHAVRDSTNLDLRESCRKFFKEFPIEHLMSYYPAAFPGDDNDYRIGVMTQSGEPDLRQAALSRAADLAIVAFDTNGEESQYLQGWLMHDHFMLRGGFGAPYEFLWANPYQPGLSFTHVPLIYHSAASGRLFVRSDWEDTAEWFGYFDGVAQLFRDGRRISINVKNPAEPLSLANAVISWGSDAPKLRVQFGEDQQAMILVGLNPSRAYQVEVDDEEVFEQTADSGGVLVIDVPPGKEIGVRVRPAPGL